MESPENIESQACVHTPPTPRPSGLLTRQGQRLLHFLTRLGIEQQSPLVEVDILELLDLLHWAPFHLEPAWKELESLKLIRRHRQRILQGKPPPAVKVDLIPLDDLFKQPHCSAAERRFLIQKLAWPR